MKYELLALQSRQPLPRILYLSNTRISVLREGEVGLSVLHSGHSIVISIPFCYLYLYLKILPFVFDSFHQFLEAGFTAFLLLT
jgi:hypothetical protein